MVLFLPPPITEGLESLFCPIRASLNPRISYKASIYIVSTIQQKALYLKGFLGNRAINFFKKNHLFKNYFSFRILCIFSSLLEKWNFFFQKFFTDVLSLINRFSCGLIYLGNHFRKPINISSSFSKKSYLCNQTSELT